MSFEIEFKKKVIIMVMGVILGFSFLSGNDSGKSTGCPIETPPELKKIIDNRIIISTGKEFMEYDINSKTCLQCHDGVLAKNVQFKDYQASQWLKSQNIPDFQIIGSNHPVNIPYPIQKKNYINKTNLDSRLVLPEGLVTCYTCHNGNYGDAHLSISNSGSGLCLSCHIK